MSNVGDAAAGTYPRELAATDSDFDPIREEPGFKELLAQAT